MENLSELIIQAREGDAGAYEQVVLRFQDMAVAYAYSVLGDFQWAGDAAQEAFVEAFFCLPRLREPAAFAGWLRRIVFKHCDRITRKRTIEAVALDEAFEVASPGHEPHQRLEESEEAREIREAVAGLPGHERSVTVLFYMGGCSHKQVAQFLQVPATTVKKRLHSARRKLRKRMVPMIQENLEGQRPSRDAGFSEKVARFTSGLSRMLDAGQSLVRALASLAETEPDLGLRQSIAQVQRDITGDGRVGDTLSQAMAKHPDSFGRDVIEAILRGESEGNLGAVLRRIGSAST